MSGGHLSKDFFDLVKSIGESRSKQEEDKIIVQEVQVLKQKMGAKDVPPRKMREYLIRMLYVEMLGHDASFGHIHAVKMAHRRALLDKRVGYLAVSLTLHNQHSFMLLLINTMQQDLKSDNYLEASMALTVVSKLVSGETIPALLPLVVKLLEHKEGNVKKKAVMVLHRFHQIDPSTLATLGAPIRKALCDSNISVMAASLNLFLDLCLEKPAAYKDLVPDFVSILKQVIEHRLPHDFNYHRVPAPWVQMNLLRILAVLGASDKNASEGMYEILREVMKRADIGINVGYAIVYECVRTITTIYPEPSLIAEAATSISRFLTSDNHNLKYLGVNALASIVQLDSKYAAQHQLEVIDALEDPDETLKRKTLDLLHQMANPQNVTVIVEKLTQYLQGATDAYLRAELVSRINQLAEKYAPNNQWFIQVMTNLFELSANASGPVSASAGGSGGAGGQAGRAMGGSEKLIKSEMAHSVLRLISENAHELVSSYPDGVVPPEEDDIRAYAVDTYIDVLTAKRHRMVYTNTLPDILLQVIAWILGEYGHVSRTTSPLDVLSHLASMLDRQVDQPAVTKAWILGAIIKMSSKVLAAGQQIPSQVVSLVKKYENSLFVDLQQRAFEFGELIKEPQTLLAVVPPTNTFDLEFEVDPNLGFLDAYVEMALKNGAKPYSQEYASKAKMRGGDLSGSAAEGLYGAAAGGGVGGLKYQAYAAPEREVAAPPVPIASSNNGLFEQYGAGAAPVAAATASSGGLGDDGLRLSGVARRWGPSGYNDPTAEKAAAPAAPAASPARAAPSTMAAMPSPQQRAQEEQQEREQREKERRAKEAAAKPRELTEKEKMAQSLFAGLGGITSPTPAAAPVRRPVVQQQQQPVRPVAQPAPAQPAQTDFLGGLIDSMPSANAPVSTTPKPAAAEPLDLLFGGSAPAASPSSATSTGSNAAGGGDLFDLLGGGAAAPAASPAAATASGPLFDNLQISAPQSQPASSSSLDAFGFGSAASASSPTSSSSASGDFDMFSSLGGGGVAVSSQPLKLGESGASSQMLSSLASLQKFGSELTLVDDSSVHLSVCRYGGETSSLLGLFLTNKTAAPLTGVRLAFHLPLGLHVSLTGDHSSQGVVGATGNHFIQIASLPPRSTTTQLVSVAIKDLMVFSPAQQPFAMTQAGVTFNGAAAPLAFNFELSLVDFLRPAPMKTDQYGQAWKSLHEEVKASARPTPVSTSPDFMSRMGGVRFYPVQTIGVENICAARLLLAPGVQLPSPAHALVLVHGKVHAHVDLIVKAKSRELAQAVAKQVMQALK